MTRRLPCSPVTVALTVALTVSLTVSLTVASLLGAGLSTTAQADTAPPQHRSAPVVKVGAWTRLSDRNVSSLSEPAALQTGAGMQALWYQQDGASSVSIRSRLVSGSGRPTTAVLPVVTGWNTLIDDPKIIDYGAQRMVVFSGLRSTSPGEKYDGAMAYSTSNDGKTWSLGSGSLSQTRSAYASYGTAAVDDQGTPVIGVFASSTSYMTLHRDISPSMPAASGDWTTTQGLGCCAYNGNLGRDAATGDIWAVWYSNSSTKAQNGVLAQRVYPTPISSWRQGPGSSVKGSSLDPGQAVAVASRKGGQVWAAYKVGYPTANKIRLWRVGSKQGFAVRAKDVRRITLTPGLGGRLWLAWTGGGSPAVKVARTDPSVTRIGAVRTLKAPGKRGSYTNVWALGGTGLGGSLHLLANAQIGTADPQIWYQRVPPGLTLSATPASLSAGRLTVKVTDAGAPVPGAKVVFRGSAKKTRASGTVVFKVSRAVPSGRYQVTGSRRGYAKGADSVRVT